MADIVMAARAVYDEPKNNNPNKGEAEPLIRQWLSDRGITATRNQNSTRPRSPRICKS